VFAGRTVGALRNYYLPKGKFDAEAGIEPWTLHDLRRTARSLMSRAGVRPDIAERVLGHVQHGVLGTSYADEKRDALAKLARLIETVTNPPAENVIPMVAHSR
jgi:integrase